MDLPVLVEEKGDGVCVISFNRPKQLNAMSVEMGEHFAALIQRINETGKATNGTLTVSSHCCLFTVSLHFVRRG